MDGSGKLKTILVITTGCLTGVALVFLLARISRQVLKRCGIRWDGFILIASWVLLLTGSLLTILTVGPGLGGLHTRSHKDRKALHGALSRLFVMGSTALSKTSCGLTLMRLTKSQPVVSRSRKLWWLILLIQVTVNLITWAAALFPLVACRLNLSSAPKSCWKSAADVIIGTTASAYSGAADVVLALLSLATIYEQNMQHLSRPLILFSMTMGIIAALAGFTQCSQIPNHDTTTFTSVSFILVISSFTESTATIAMAASLPIPGLAFHFSAGSSVDQMSRAGSRASTAFWHDRGKPEDIEGFNYIYRPHLNLGHAAVVSSEPAAERHGQVSSRGISAIPNGDVARVPPPAMRDSKASLFERTWKTISSALHDLEPIWAHRRMEDAMQRFYRPYTPSVYSSRTMDGDCASAWTMRWDNNQILNRLSDIVEESWRDRSILKTPEPAALIYATQRGIPPYTRGSQSDWDIENGSMI